MTFDIWEIRIMSFYLESNRWPKSWLNNIVNKLYKTGVINDPLGQTHSHASSEHCFPDLKRGDGRTDGQHVRKQ